MSKFYTNIEVRGNSILYRGYEDGIPVQQKIAYQPHVFVNTKDDTDLHVFKTKQPVKKKTFGSIDEMKDFVEQYKDVPNFKFYGCSNLVRQFTGNMFRGDIDWDYAMTKIWLFDIETKVGENSKGFPVPDKALEEILLISMVDHFTQKVYQWSTKPVLPTNKIYTAVKDIDFRCFGSEKAMLKDFLMFFATTRIDVLSGWNSEFFDIPYIVNRIKNVLGEDAVKFLSPWKVVKPRSVRLDNGDVNGTYDILGITHLDYLDLYKKFNPGSKESFKLDYIAELELGERKVELPGESFRDNYENHWETFVYYSVVDSLLLSKMETKLLQVRLAMQLAYLAKCQIGDVLSSMRLWESIIYNYFLDINVVEEWDKERNEKHQIVGAYVHDPKPGKYGWTVSVDALSKYPSIMMQNNLSPETIFDFDPTITMDNVLAGKHDNIAPPGTIMSCNGLFTKKGDLGMIPILVKRMFDMRKQTKNKMLDLKKQLNDVEIGSVDYIKFDSDISAMNVAQLAYKVAANSFYGCLALTHFKYYDYRLAEAVTSTGQVFIKHTMKEVNSILSKILGYDKEYGILADTDSYYFDAQDIVDRYCKGKTDQEIVTFLEKFVFDVLQPELNKRLALIASKMGIDDCKIFYKLECIGPSILCVAKKRYAFDILYSEGVRYDKPKMKVMGIEIVRSSTPSVVKDYLKESLALCLRSDEKNLQKKVKEIKKQFMQCSYTDISFPRGVNGLDVYADSASIYKKGCPIHVRGALLYNHTLDRLGLDSKYPMISDGDKIKFVALKMPNTIHENVIAFNGKIPAEFGLEKFVDYKMQFEKAYLGPLEGILEAIGWEAEEKITLEF